MMKKGFLLFAILLPFFLAGDYQLIPAWASTPISMIVGFYFLFKWTQKEVLDKEVEFKSIFLQTIKTGIYFSVWLGLYQYLLVVHLQPELLMEQIRIFEASGQMPENLAPNAIESPQLSKLLRSPLPWFFSSVLINCFLFSMLGLIFGLIFKVKSKP